jgi:hypothetical protein
VEAFYAVDILRNLLGWTGVNIVQYNEVFQKRFEYDVARGKPKGVAHGSIARRLAVILYTCLAKKVAFDPALVGAGGVALAMNGARDVS